MAFGSHDESRTTPAWDAMQVCNHETTVGLNLRGCEVEGDLRHLQKNNIKSTFLEHNRTEW